jgi:hypothetical protein
MEKIRIRDKYSGSATLHYRDSEPVASYCQVNYRYVYKSEDMIVIRTKPYRG